MVVVVDIYVLYRKTPFVLILFPCSYLVGEADHPLKHLSLLIDPFLSGFENQS